METRRYIVWLWLVALTARLIYAFSVSLIPANISGIDMDAVEYDYLGWSIAQGQGVVNAHGEPTALRFPGYLYLLGLVYFIFGHSHLAAVIIQALLGSITPLLIYLIARELLEEKTSRIAGILAAGYPVFIYYVGYLMSENLFLLLLNILIYMVVRFKQKAGWKRLAFMGVVTGLLGLTRGVGLPFLGLVPLYIFLKQKGNLKAKIKPVIIVFIAAIITLTPWTVRNYKVFGKVMLPSSEGGVILWLCFNTVPISNYYNITPAFAYVDSVGRKQAKSEEFYRLLAANNIFGYTGMQEVWRNSYPDEPMPPNEIACAHAYGHKAMEIMFKDPVIWVVKSFTQIFRFWHVLDERGRYVYGYGFILPFFIAGFWLTRRRIGEFFPLYLFPLVLYGISIIFFAEARFRMPFEGVWLIVGSVGIERFLGLFRKIYWGYAGLILYFLSNWFLRLHSLDVRMAIRSILGALGFHLSDIK